MSAGEHKDFAPKPGDSLILSARIIPGNEKPILTMCNAFLRLGVSIITTREHPGIHVSGHAYIEDLELLLDTIQPKRFMPVHGSFSQLLANHRLAESHLPTNQGSLLVQTGDVIDLSPESATVKGTINIPVDYVDTDAGIPLPYDTLRQRLKIGELGLIIVTGTYDPAGRKWAYAPDIDVIGLEFPDHIRPSDWIATERARIESLVPQLLFGKLLKPESVREEIRIYLRRRLHQLFKKKPVVIVKITVT
jgi:ribonuclease J